MVGFSSVARFAHHAVRYMRVYSPGSPLCMPIAAESALRAVGRVSFAVPQFLYGRSSDDNFKEGICDLSIAVLFTYCSFSYWGGMAGMGWFVIDCALPEEQRVFKRYFLSGKLIANCIVRPLELRAIKYIGSVPQFQPMVNGIKKMQGVVSSVQGVVSFVLHILGHMQRVAITILSIIAVVFTCLAMLFITVGFVVSFNFVAKLL